MGNLYQYFSPLRLVGSLAKKGCPMNTQPIKLASKTTGSSGLALVGIFVLTIFLSASLLFSVQPLFTKFTLPLLGGSSNVWNTAMVFFQGTLLCGYIYAHLITKYFPFFVQVVVHCIVMAIGLIFLPISIATGWTPPDSGFHAFWLIGLFGFSIGLPFFAISANAPLLQKWFSYTDHKNADDPYFLYAASNAGSLLSLCLYPLLFEPFLRLGEQAKYWTYGYIALIVLLVILSLIAHGRKANTFTPTTEKLLPPVKITPSKRLLWIGLAFIPSSLMLGVTSHMSNNIASAPFLWIIPLVLYLLTFIIVFATNPIVSTQQLKRLFPYVIILAIISGFVLKFWIFLSISLSLVCYFIIALMCHSRLSDERPTSENLTEFYIFMSLGGVLGGIFNALLAPIVFDRIYEYLLVLLLADLAIPREGEAGKKRNRASLILIVTGSLCFISLQFLIDKNINPYIASIIGALIMVAGITLIQRNKKFVIPNILAVSAIFVSLAPIYLTGLSRLVHLDRSFFGVIRVTADQSDHGIKHRFRHGDTIHNVQLQDEELKKIPLAYYAPGNTFDRAIQVARASKPSLDLAVIGLGAGALACYERPDDNWVYFEIDPAVVEMALDPKLFSYMEKCSFDSDIRIGDARLTLEGLDDGSLDLIIVDAFSSDAIPTHLLTREALKLYRSKLTPNGLIFFHTSNRLMDVSSVVVRLANDAEMASKFIAMRDFDEYEYRELYHASTGVLVGPKALINAGTSNDPNWVEFAPSKYVKTWSDDYSNIIGPMIALFKREKNDESSD